MMIRIKFKEHIVPSAYFKFLSNGVKKKIVVIILRLIPGHIYIALCKKDNYMEMHYLFF